MYLFTCDRTYLYSIYFFFSSIHLHRKWTQDVTAFQSNVSCDQLMNRCWQAWRTSVNWGSGALRAYRAAAASWFLRLGEPGSVDRALAASSSLLEDMEMVLRLDTTWVWSSLVCPARGESKSSEGDWTLYRIRVTFITSYCSTHVQRYASTIIMLGSSTTT